MDRVGIAKRLMAMQSSLRTVMEVAEAQARLCDEADAKGLAMSLFMVRESLAVYATELNKFVKSYLDSEEEGL